LAGRETATIPITRGRRPRSVPNPLRASLQPHLAVSMGRRIQISRYPGFSTGCETSTTVQCNGFKRGRLNLGNWPLSENPCRLWQLRQRNGRSKRNNRVTFSKLSRHLERRTSLLPQKGQSRVSFQIMILPRQLQRLCRLPGPIQHFHSSASLCDQ
jgi:hypothetical protein